jgi:hypothetical protein
MEDTSKAVEDAVAEDETEVDVSDTGRPKGTTSHHSMSPTVRPESGSVETYCPEIPPRVSEPFDRAYRTDEEEDVEEEVDVDVAEDDKLTGGATRARPKTG